MVMEKSKQNGRRRQHSFPLFKPRASRPESKLDRDPSTTHVAGLELDRSTDPDVNSDADLGLADWLLQTIAELGLKKLTPVQATVKQGEREDQRMPSLRGRLGFCVGRRRRQDSSFQIGGRREREERKRSEPDSI
ncbi:hypothetical protein ACLB2K_073928 [Fragaria x ananassa]